MTEMTDLKKFLASYPELEELTNGMDGVVAVHAVAGYQEQTTDYVHIVHWRLESLQELAELADRCFDSMIRIILIFDDGKTKGLDVFPDEIPGAKSFLG
jgi:hypothetical protein